MKTINKVNLISLLLGIAATMMFILGITSEMLPPMLTGAGFFLIIWPFRALEQKK